MTTEKPTPGQRRCMIWRHTRHLEDGCDTCGLSTVACAANRDINRNPCCNTCSH